ncbi:MAG: M48 family metallopeptidase [Kofleriaceae bacterium]
MKVAALALLAACTPARTYLGAETPAACTSSDAEKCASALAERDLLAGELDVYQDSRLRAYVQDVTNRLARNSDLKHPPRVIISNHDGTYAPFGNAIVIGRITIQKLGTEAELAAVIAHEMVHVEGHHASVSLFGPETDKQWYAARRDAEGIADERAVALLERAGYSPTAMPRALLAELEGDDEEHPPKADRIARVSALAANRNGFEGRFELLQHVDRMVVGRDTRLGIAVGNAWVIASLGIALDFPEDDVARTEGDGLILRHGRSSLNAYAIGAPWARELASRLEQREADTTNLGRVTIGIAPDRIDTATDPVGRMEDAIRATLPQPLPGTWVVVVERCPQGAPCGGLVLELAVHGDLAAQKRWLGGLRQATEKELLAAEPAHIVVTQAQKLARISTLVDDCTNPQAALQLDDPARQLDVGAPFKCTDR